MLVSAKAYTNSRVFLFLVKILFLVLFFLLNALILVCGIRLGHQGYKAIEQICKNFPYVKMPNHTICNVCHFSKQQKLPFHKVFHTLLLF